MNEKTVIYQVFTRLFGNKNVHPVPNGTLEQNGSGKFNDITSTVLKDLKKSGYTHIWYIGCLAHASTTDYQQYGVPKEYPEIIKGKAGSPYAIRDFYDVDPDLAVDVSKRWDEFSALVDRTHQAGLKVIIDFVPNHLARNYASVSKPKRVKDFGKSDDKTVGFHPQNNFYYFPNESLDLSSLSVSPIHYTENPAKATGNDCFRSNPGEFDWYETVKLNYGVDYQSGNKTYFDPIPDTWLKMKDILLFWAKKKIDGFRCDMAEMVPLKFWEWVVPQVHAKYPDIIFFAETYNPNEYRNFLANGTFDYLYDKVGLYDVLRDVACQYRPASDITFILNSVGDIQPRMINFLENHDEQRIASDYFLKDGDFGKAAMIVTACVNTNPIMIYFGQELGERGMDEEGFSGRNGRTSIFDYWSVDSVRRWNNNGKWNNKLLTDKELELKQFYKKLLNLLHSQKSLSEGLFYDLMSANYENPHFDSTRQFAFLRGHEEELLLIVSNFSNEDQEVTVYIPEDAFRFFSITKHAKCVAQALLSDKHPPIESCYEYPFRTTIRANSGEIFKLSFA